MEPALISPANASFLGIPLVVFSVLIPVAGVALFAYIMARRLAPIALAAPDKRFDRLLTRTFHMVKFAIGQYRHPRYLRAGVIHIGIFAGFMIISLHSITLVMEGIKAGWHLPGLGGTGGVLYGMLKDVLSTVVLVAALAAIYRRTVVRPERYKVPEHMGKDHTTEAVFVLLMISGLMVSDTFYEGSLAAAAHQQGLKAHILIPFTLNWMSSIALASVSLPVLQKIHYVFYFCHEIIFFSFLCFLPNGKHFHVITSLPNVFFAKLNKGTVKPVRWDVKEEKLDDLESFGVKKFQDFTWKHILDFYSCADCGRCSDRCPANRVGRPLSPRFITIKARDFAFKNYPLKGSINKKQEPLIGQIYTEDEIWSCTTCGACEEECPLFIEYIDKMVDLRRGMVDEGMVPQSLQKPLMALEKRGNPYGKIEKKRAAWVKDKEFAAQCTVKVLDGKGKDTADTLYFVDSITSYDDRMQLIAQSTARILSAMEKDFGILGPAEKDAGNEVRRFGEEMLFMELRDKNKEAIQASGARHIVTADPHAFNCLKKDYGQSLPVEHISQTLARSIKAGKLKLKPLEDTSKVYTYHDPCYLGRHNKVYDEPRAVLDAIGGLKRIEMTGNCRDRSFCCGGGGLMLFYEPDEKERMGTVRVKMAKEAGANVIVTACPFCMVNVEDAIKTSGLEGEMEVIDLAELVSRQLAE